MWSTIEILSENMISNEIYNFLCQVCDKCCILRLKMATIGPNYIMYNANGGKKNSQEWALFDLKMHTFVMYGRNTVWKHDSNEIYDIFVSCRW